MSWDDLSRGPPPRPGATYAERAARRTWAGANAGPGPFGFPDVGMPAPTGAVANLPSKEPVGSTGPAAYGLPPSRFLQQRPGSTSFLDAATTAGARQVIVGPTVRPPGTYAGAMPVAGPYGGSGGALAPGLREPFGPSQPFASPGQDLFQRITGYDRAWGAPPPMAGMTWSAGRAVYEPSPDGWALNGGVRALHEHQTALAGMGVYLQPHLDAGGRWAYRWAVVPTPLPEAGRPYELLPLSRYQLGTDLRSGHPADLQRQLEGASGEEAKGLLQQRREATFARLGSGAATTPPGTYVDPVTGRTTRAYGAEELTRPVEYPLTAYAWVPRHLLPKGCPYSEMFLPVPQADYVSGRWLEPDYTPSIPLPRPYDQLPAWRCGVIGTPGSGRGKGGGGGGPPPDMQKHLTGLPPGSGGSGPLGGASPIDPNIRWMQPRAEGGAPGASFGSEDTTGAMASNAVRGAFASRALSGILFRPNWPLPNLRLQYPHLRSRAELLESILVEGHLSPEERRKVEAQLKDVRLQLAQAFTEIQQLAAAEGQPRSSPDNVVLRAQLAKARQDASTAKSSVEAAAAQRTAEQLMQALGAEAFRGEPDRTGQFPPAKPEGWDQAAASSPVVKENTDQWDPRRTTPPGRNERRYVYRVTVYASTISLYHMLIGLEVIDIVWGVVVWRRVFSWAGDGLRGFDAFWNDGRYAKGSFDRHPYTYERSWDMDRQQFDDILSAAVWWVGHSSFDREKSNCTHFVSALLGAAGINPFEPGPGVVGGKRPRAKSGQGFDAPPAFTEGLTSSPRQALKRTSDWWGMTEQTDEVPVPRNVGSDVPSGTPEIR